MLFNIKDFPVVFLSYNEPNRHINFQRLLEICPHALHINGVKGIDTAHKLVAETVKNLSSHVIIVEGDNYVSENLLIQEVNLRDEIDVTKSVLSFSAKNYINGNIYSAGGIKVWPVDLLMSMRTHENSEFSIDFDTSNFLQLNRYISEVHNEGSPAQAWLSGFRSIIKLCTKNNKLINNLEELNWRDYERLWRWMHIGQDIENGIYSIFGARQAAYLAFTNQTYTITDINDFEHMTSLFDSNFEEYNYNLINECNRLGNVLCEKTNDFRIVDVYDPTSSFEYKQKIVSSRCSAETFIKFKYPGTNDVIYVDHKNKNSSKNLELVREKYPKVKTIEATKDFLKNYQLAAEIATTDYFFIVESNYAIINEFYFEYYMPFNDYPKVRIWHSKNSKDGTIMEKGGVKLLPRFLTVHMKTEELDLESNIGKPYEAVVQLSNYTESLDYDKP